MIFHIYFNFFSDAKSISGKEKVLKRVGKILTDKYGETSVNYIEEFKFIVSIEKDKWSLLLFNLIEFSQAIGQQWIITGGINFECNLWSNHSKIIGVSSIGVDVDNAVQCKNIQTNWPNIKL